METKYHVVFKKNEESIYEFYHIFISDDYDDVNLESGDEDFSFVSGKVCSVNDDDFVKLISSEDKDSIGSIIKFDDLCDDYFSFVVDVEQLEKYSKDIKLNYDLSSDLSVLYSEYLYKKFFDSRLSNINNISDKVVAFDIEFSKHKYNENEFMNKIYNSYVDFDSCDDLSFDDFNVNEVIDDIKSRVIGQDRVVETIVNNIYNNQKIIDTLDEDFIRTSKVNILIDGSTATGKTLILRQCEKHFSIPFYRVPVTSFSTVGYKGDDLVNILHGLLKRANGNIELAQRGVVVLDEFDKLASSSDKGLEVRNGLQHELLPYIDGDKITLDLGFGSKIEFDTSKITFIALGAFTDLNERKIKENNKNYIGFSDSNLKKERTYNISIQDYIDEGINRELIGRFGLLISTNRLDYDKLMKILKESKISPALNLINLGKMYGVDIVISDEILGRIAECALKDGTGARGLKTIIGNLQNVILADVIAGKEKRIVIDEEMLNKSRDFMIRGY